jgi:hypothetical protein
MSAPQFDAMQPKSTNLAVSYPKYIRISPARQQRKFTLFKAEFFRLQKAGACFGDTIDPHFPASIKESSEKIASLEKRIMNDLEVKKEQNALALNEWYKNSTAVLTTYRKVIAQGVERVQTNLEECLRAYKMIGKDLDGEDERIASIKKELDVCIERIQESLSSKRAMLLPSLIARLQSCESAARRNFRNLSAQKIKGIKQRLDSISSLFDGVLTGQSLHDLTITPYPLMAAFEKQDHLERFSTIQMKVLLEETAARKKFFKHALLLRKGFLSDTHTLAQLAGQFLQAKDELEACRKTLQKKFFAPQPLALPNDVNELLSCIDALSISTTPESSMSRPEPSPSETSPDSMTLSPPLPHTELVNPYPEERPPSAFSVLSPSPNGNDEGKSRGPVSFITSLVAATSSKIILPKTTPPSST